MAGYMVKLDSSSALISDPGSKEATLQNLMLNMMGGLRYEDLSVEEKELLHKNGYPHKS